MAVAALDVDAEFEAITKGLRLEREKRVNPPRITLHDGNWVQRGRVTHMYTAEFSEIENETGIGKIEMPADYYLAKWVTDHDNRSTKNIHVRVEKDGIRWTGRMWQYEIDRAADGKAMVRVLFKHDYEEFKHIICWSNPFLPAEVQFPRLWLLFGPAKWCLKTTLFVNILRLEASLWMLPDNPLDLSEWFDLNQSHWSMVVAPDNPATDVSPLAVVHSRFKYFHEVQKDIADDAQLTPTFKRWFEGDPEPWAGANLKHGCLIIDYEDNSGWLQGTSFGGSLFTGLIHSIVNIASDGLTEGIDIMPDPAWPEEYSEPGWKGSFPQAPGIVYREGEHTGIETSLFIGSPAKDVQHVTGGHSMPGVNELISAAIQMAGDMIAAMIGVPPVGGAADAILKPLYTDVLLAFMAWKDPWRATALGDFHYHERFAEGADRAYTLKAIIALRASMWATRETFTHKLTVADGAPWLIGARGKGHFYLGHRIGSTVRGAPKGKIYVDRVKEVKLTITREKAPTWEITIGEREFKDPVQKAFEKIQELFGIAKDLGLI